MIHCRQKKAHIMEVQLNGGSIADKVGTSLSCTKLEVNDDKLLPCKFTDTVMTKRTAN